MQHLKRLRRDIQELFSENLRGDNTHIVVHEVPMTSQMDTSSSLVVMRIQLSICLLSGPYRGGHFSFGLDIPSSYPFRCPQVWKLNEDRPIWHPNVDLRTGEVALPLEWSPVLTLIHLTYAIQMMLLTPSIDHPLNIEAYKLYIENPNDFDEYVQSIMEGCNIGDFYFPDMRNMHCQFCNGAYNHNKLKAENSQKIQNNELPQNDQKAQIEFDQFHSNNNNNSTKSPFQGRKRSRRCIVEEQLSNFSGNGNSTSFPEINVLVKEFGDTISVGNRKRERDELIDYQGNEIQSRTATPSQFSQTNIVQNNRSNVFNFQQNNDSGSTANKFNWKEDSSLFRNHVTENNTSAGKGEGNEKLSEENLFKRTRMDCIDMQNDPEEHENENINYDFNSHSHHVSLNMEVNVFRPVLLENENSFAVGANQNSQNQTTPLLTNQTSTSLVSKGFTFNTPTSVSTDNKFFGNSRYR